MKTDKFIYYILAGAIGAIVIFIAKESFFQPGAERFEGKFEELDTYRNENNTGPIVRLYAVKVLDENEDWMKEYGNSLPHTKYGRTIVFFFDREIGQEIKLSPKEPHFSDSFSKHLISSYEKTPMGEVRFISKNE